MNTDRLIDALSARLEPADRGRVWRALAGALIFGAAVAVGGVLAVLGLRTPMDMTRLGFLLAKLAFTVATLGLATVALVRLMRPGADGRRMLFLVAVPFLIVALCAVFSLASTHWTDWGSMALGRQWLACLIFIPLFAVVPFAVLIWVLRTTGAPTDLARAGAIAGLLAGSVGATAYALHCPDDSLPFVAIWYGGTIALCTFIGAKLGPRLLRW